jgi:hypothetical protein
MNRINAAIRLFMGVAVCCVIMLNCQSSIEPDYPATDLIEFESVYQFLQAFSIWRDKIPDDPFDYASPADLMTAIHDTLRGNEYTRYYDNLHFASVSAASDSIESSVYLDSLTPSTALLTITGFEGWTCEDFGRVAPGAAKYKNIVVDVRQNRGGYLNMVDSIIQSLLPSETQVIQALYRNYSEDERDYVTMGWETWKTAHGPDTMFKNKNYAVLMDEYSASASEILISALYEGAHAPMFGARTYGKGIGQVHLSRRTRPTVQVTFLRLKGVSPRIGDYHRTGIEPDTVPALMREQAAALDSSRQLIYFAVKTLEPEISVSDINYPSKRLHGTFGLSAAPACVKVIAEEEVFRRQGQ